MPDDINYNNQVWQLSAVVSYEVCGTLSKKSYKQVRLLCSNCIKFMEELLKSGINI